MTARVIRVVLVARVKMLGDLVLLGGRTILVVAHHLSLVFLP